MKKLFSALIISMVLFVSGAAYAQTQVYLYVDSAPNKYGSSAYAPWEIATFTAVAADTFVNMSNGINSTNVGTTNFEIQDEVVYSFGDLGKRLTWIYWITNTTIDELTAANFQISLTNVWDGVSSDFYFDYYGSTWLTPTTWINYTNSSGVSGVIGTAGMAWWGAHGVNTQEALDADIAAWGAVDEQWIFNIKMDGYVDSITSRREAVPEPATMFLLGLGLIGLVGLRRKI